MPAVSLNRSPMRARRALSVKVFLLRDWCAPFFFSLPTLEFALFGLEPTFAVRTRAFSWIARVKLLSVGRGPSEHGDLCNEHTKGQQRAVSSTFRVLTQAQYQTRAVAAKKKPSRSGF